MELMRGSIPVIFNNDPQQLLGRCTVVDNQAEQTKELTITLPNGELTDAFLNVFGEGLLAVSFVYNPTKPSAITALT